MDHGSVASGDPTTHMATATKTLKETSHRVRIKIRAYDHKIIDQSTRTIIETAERTGVHVIGPVPLPTEKKKWTVNRSTFVHKNAREQFEMRVHKRIVDIVDPNAKTIDALTSLNLPAGVDVEIKM
jgi:small subunit ribosomal protein S10